MSASISSTRAPPTASAIAMLTAVVVLPSSGCELATATTRAPLPGNCAGERGADRAIRFAEIVRHRAGNQRMAIAADDRHQAEELQLQAAGDVVRRLDGVVEIVDAERDAEAQRQAERDRIDPVAAMVGRGRRAGGTSARSTTRTLLVRLLATTRSSFSRVSSWL